MRPMTADDLRAFAYRDWAAVARSKRAFWAERFRRAGSEPARTAATALLEHARRLGVAPSLQDREDDLAGHMLVRDRLDRAARAFTRR
jgi:hypothetical protein